MCHIRIRIFVSNFPLLTKKKALLMFRVYEVNKKNSRDWMSYKKKERPYCSLFSLSLSTRKTTKSRDDHHYYYY